VESELTTISSFIWTSADKRTTIANLLRKGDIKISVSAPHHGGETAGIRHRTKKLRTSLSR